jgi:hypothetical protein
MDIYEKMEQRRKLLSQEGTRPKNRIKVAKSYHFLRANAQKDYDNREFDRDKLDALQYNMLIPSKSKLNSESGFQGPQPCFGQENDRNSNTKIIDYLQ